MNGILKKAIIDVHKSQGPCRANGGCIVRMQGWTVVLHMDFGNKVYFWKLLLSVFSFDDQQRRVGFYDAAGKQQTNSRRFIFMIT